MLPGTQNCPYTLGRGTLFLTMAVGSTVIGATLDKLVQRLDHLWRWGAQLSPGVSAVDGDEVLIEDATELQQLTAIAFGRIKQITDAGRALRKQVLAATTTDEVGLVTDVRE